MQITSNWDIQDVFLRKVLAKVEKQGLDCRVFRPSYVERRIAGRMRATNCESYFSYNRYLDGHPDEHKTLIDALTINVTQFFRDESVYKELEKKIFPTIIANSSVRGKHTIRIWSAGCSSGEEVYSLAMIAAACLEKSGYNLRCSIYGADIDEDSITKGRKGVYPIDALKTIPERYRKYTIKAGPSTFSFTPEILSMARFIRMDIFADKPIKHVDMVLCRNVMIYLERQQQHQLTERFYQSILQGGFLVIGKSERLKHDRLNFTTVNSVCRIYRKVASGEHRA